MDAMVGKDGEESGDGGSGSGSDEDGDGDGDGDDREVWETEER